MGDVRPILNKVIWAIVFLFIGYLTYEMAKHTWSSMRIGFSDIWWDVLFWVGLVCGGILVAYVWNITHKDPNDKINFE
jgi:hypothetical protein